MNDFNDTLQQAYEQEIARTIDSYTQASHQNSVNYIFITDLHGDSHPDSLQRQLRALVSLVCRLRSDNDPTNDIDFVVLGGDISTGLYKDFEAYKNHLDRYLAPLNDCPVPVLILRGNHDDNSYYFMYAKEDGVSIRESSSPQQAQHYLNTNAVGADRWYDYMLYNYSNDSNAARNHISSRVHDAQDPDSPYYYFDLPAKKTRIVCLDISTQDPITPTSNGALCWFYSDGQMGWLIRQALTAPDDYNYIFLSHMGYEVDLTKEPTPYHYLYKNFDVLQGILTAFQSRTAYNSTHTFYYTDELGNRSLDYVACDYTGRTSASKILSFQFGHLHYDFGHVPTDTKIATITTGSAGEYRSGQEDSVGHYGPTNISQVYARENATITEALFDVMRVSPHCVHQIRFGAGEDKTFLLPE